MTAAAVTALRELVALKDLKDEAMRRQQRRLYRFASHAGHIEERDTVNRMLGDYNRRKPAAWAAARAALAEVAP